jgi:hypothetical protein
MDSIAKVNGMEFKHVHLFDATLSKVHDQTFQSTHWSKIHRGGQILIMEDSIVMEYDEYYDVQKDLLLTKSTVGYSIYLYRPIYGYRKAIEGMSMDEITYQLKPDTSDLQLIGVELWLDDASVLTVYSNGTVVHTEAISYISQEKEYRYRVYNKFVNSKIKKL